LHHEHLIHYAVFFPSDFSTPLGASEALNVFKSGLETRKLLPIPPRGCQELKTKPQNTTNAGSRTPQKFFVCCSVAITVPRLFVELKMTLLLQLQDYL
jgi:hypothetical protein